MLLLSMLDGTIRYRIVAWNTNDAMGMERISGKIAFVAFHWHTIRVHTIDRVLCVFLFQSIGNIVIHEKD